MSKLKQFALKIRREEWLAIILFVVVVSINIFVYNQQVPLGETFRWMVYYFTFGQPFYGLFFMAIYAIALFEFYRGLVKITTTWLVDKDKPSEAIIKDLFKKLLRPLRFIFPIALVTLPAYQLLAHFSYQLRFVGKDVILATADQNILGGLLFVFLPTKFNALWISQLVYYAYISLAVVFSALLVWLFLAKKEMLLRVVITSIIFSFVFSFPLFYAMPCQDPSHAFIENNRNNPIPLNIAQELTEYKPSEFVKNKIADISKAETNVKRDNSVPISCFPSMHAVWSLIAIYFFARIDRRTIFLSIPWLTINLAGGLYYAQHYLVDYIVAIPVAMLSVSAAYFLLKIGRRKG